MLVLVLVVGVVLWGARSVTADVANAPTSPTPMVGSTIAVGTTTDSTSPVADPATREPAESASTVTPLPKEQSTERAEPAPTDEPAPAQRPAAPDTGLDGTSLIVERGASGRLEVAFTFDAGEGAGHTEEILDLLDANGIRGSFGVTGEWAKQNPELTRRIVEDGHMLINHTYDHRSFTGASTGADPLSDEERLAQVEETRRIILEIAGYETAPYFRFPYGDYDPESLDLLARAGYDYTLWWSCDTEGWNGHSPQEIAQNCGPEAEEGGPGAILLMHVVDDNDFAALPVLIERYQEAGYDFVTMEELIQP